MSGSRGILWTAWWLLGRGRLGDGALVVALSSAPEATSGGQFCLRLLVGGQHEHTYILCTVVCTHLGVSISEFEHTWQSRTQTFS
jgi:hypothetical protein